ncbi:MAG TPA: hypothetical protein VJT72_23795 [Pseudonocardiaceae bacterium]|nr:hypothetical protein [Pseudonocardiaceae bacterium]
MSAPDPPTGPPPPQSPLSEAVEQAADAAKIWWEDISDFAKNEADQLSSGDYGLKDLASAQVNLLRICVRNTIKSVGVLSDNLALMSYPSPGTPPPPRTMSVPVSIPPNVNVKLTASDLVGQLQAQRISSTTIHIQPEEPSSEATSVTVEIKCPPVPSDLYEGRLHSADGTVSIPFWVAINELGEPLP